MNSARPSFGQPKTPARTRSIIGWVSSQNVLQHCAVPTGQTLPSTLHPMGTRGSQDQAQSQFEYANHPKGHGIRKPKPMSWRARVAAPLGQFFGIPNVSPTSPRAPSRPSAPTNTVPPARSRSNTANAARLGKCAGINLSAVPRESQNAELLDRQCISGAIRLKLFCKTTGGPICPPVNRTGLDPRSLLNATRGAIIDHIAPRNWPFRPRQ